MIKREIKKYKNGLKHVHYYVPFLKTVTMCFAVKVGSYDEVNSDLFGLSHFLEHMVFNGSHKYPSRVDTDKLVTSLGAYQNAWTWYNETVYYTNSNVEEIPKLFDILKERVFSPVFREEDVQKEKGIVQEERVMGENDPFLSLYYKMVPKIYKNTPLAHSVIGTKKSITNFNKKLLDDYHSYFYSPRNVVLITYGGINLKDINEIVSKDLSKLQNKDASPFNEELSYELRVSKKNYQHIVVKKDVPAGFYQDLMIFPKPEKLEEFGKWLVLKTILSEGKSAILENEIRIKKSLVSDYDLEIFLNKGYMNLLFVSSTTKKTLPIIKKKYNEIMESFVNIIDQKTIERAKGSLYGGVISLIEDPFSITESDFINLELFNLVTENESGFEDFIEVLKKIDLKSFKDFVNNNKYIKRISGFLY